MSGAKIVDELRAGGYKVRVGHHRIGRNADVLRQLKRIAFSMGDTDALIWLEKMERFGSVFSPDPFGGRTTVKIFDGNDVELARGWSVCRPDERFNRKLGLAVAAGRARKNLHTNIPF